MRGLGVLILERDWPDDFGNCYVPATRTDACWVWRYSYELVTARSYYFQGC